MTELRMYSTDTIFRAVKDLLDRYTDGFVHSLELASALDKFLFRDSQKKYWFMDIANKQWFRFEGETWQAAEPANGWLEGSQSVIEYAEIPETKVEELEDLFPEDTKFEATFVLDKIINSAFEAYKRGDLSTMDVETFIHRYYLADKGGRFWTMGVHSRSWYYFNDYEWVKEDGKPDEDNLIRFEPTTKDCEKCGEPLKGEFICSKCGHIAGLSLVNGSNEADVNVVWFLIYGIGSLPEQVTGEWEPPHTFAGLPELELLPGLMGGESNLDDGEAGIKCASCGAINPGDSRYCNQCGASLGCPNCGTFNTPGSKFCNQCGNPLTPEISE